MTKVQNQLKEKNISDLFMGYVVNVTGSNLNRTVLAESNVTYCN